VRQGERLVAVKVVVPLLGLVASPPLGLLLALPVQQTPLPAMG
jgi:hypothetical protein